MRVTLFCRGAAAVFSVAPVLQVALRQCRRPDVKEGDSEPGRVENVADLEQTVHRRSGVADFGTYLGKIPVMFVRSREMANDVLDDLLDLHDPCVASRSRLHIAQ